MFGSTDFPSDLYKVIFDLLTASDLAALARSHSFFRNHIALNQALIKLLNEKIAGQKIAGFFYHKNIYFIVKKNGQVWTHNAETKNTKREPALDNLRQVFFEPTRTLILQNDGSLWIYDVSKSKRTIESLGVFTDAHFIHGTCTFADQSTGLLVHTKDNILAALDNKYFAIHPILPNVKFFISECRMPHALYITSTNQLRKNLNLNEQNVFEFQFPVPITQIASTIRHDLIFLDAEGCIWIQDRSITLPDTQYYSTPIKTAITDIERIYSNIDGNYKSPVFFITKEKTIYIDTLTKENSQDNVATYVNNYHLNNMARLPINYNITALLQYESTLYFVSNNMCLKRRLFDNALSVDALRNQNEFQDNQEIEIFSCAAEIKQLEKTKLALETRGKIMSSKFIISESHKRPLPYTPTQQAKFNKPA